VSESEMAMHGHGGALMEESPYSIPSRKLTMWLFIISDAVTFGPCCLPTGIFGSRLRIGRLRSSPGASSMWRS